MTWIAILCIGVALGWALEFLLDIAFWGRRNRRLESQLSSCRSDRQRIELKLNQAQEVVAKYRLKEAEFEQCQYDLTDLSGRHNDLEVRAEKISLELRSSRERVGRLDRHHSKLKAEYDDLHDTLEDVDQWVESSMRRRIWDKVSLKSGIDRTKERSAAYARSMATSAAEKMREAAGSISGSMSTAKTHIGREIDHSRPVRWLKHTYCNVWALTNSIFKRGKMPSTCSHNSK